MPPQERFIIKNYFSTNFRLLVLHYIFCMTIKKNGSNIRGNVLYVGIRQSHNVAHILLTEFLELS